ncbi:MAG: ABC transporter permease [Candidatus Binatia bacterium]|nr:ABC transporter permease [Candidatus Binatia bacterium]
MTSWSEAWSTALALLWRADPEVVQAVWTSLYVSLVATAIAGVTGIPCGVLLARSRFPGRGIVEVTIKTLTALPTVVVGLLFYALLSRSGPLGVLGLLYTPTAIILGEAALVFPLVAALTMSLVAEADPRIEATAKTLGASPRQAVLTLLFELRYGVVGIAVATFGRLLAELGVALMLGGNIRGSTRTLTTAIALETSKGDFALALALGLLLLLLALAVNLLVWWASPKLLP